MSAFVYIDVSKKQEFIYRHNSLKENLFSSGIIKAVTENLAVDSNCPTNQENSNNINFINNQGDRWSDSYNTVIKDVTRRLKLTLNGFLEKHYAKCYCFEFSGGGNSIIRFCQKDRAEQFIKEYSRAVLKYYPELELYISLVTVEQSETIKPNEMEIRKQLIAASDKLKDQRRPVFRRWSYGIEAMDEAGRAKVASPLDQEQLQEVRNLLSIRLNEKLDDESIVKKTIELQDYEKHEGGKSYIGIIAIDGNRMGEMIRELESFEQLRQFSSVIHELYLAAVVKALRMYGTKKKTNQLAPLYYTPIVLAGDDVCLITEGEYAIQLAAQIVKHIQDMSLEEPYCSQLYQLGCSEQLTACAGVSIVKVKYPFFEAVRAAEELCHNAKQAMYRVQLSNNDDHDLQPLSSSFINWSIVEGQVREKQTYDQFIEYKNIQQLFHIKPLRIDQKQAYDNGIVSYDAFRQLVMKVIDLPNKSSFLQKIKQAQYNGWDAYQLLFELNKMDVSQEINDIVEVVFKDCTIEVQHAALKAKNKERAVYTYVLNDVLEAIDFMAKEGQQNETDSVSTTSGTT